jgi:hypothetical protein
VLQMMDHRRSNFTGEQKLRAMREADYPGGVVVDPVPITEGEEITVLYYGLLAQSGADQIWMRVGYGSNDRWQDIKDFRMERTANGWVKTFPITNAGRLNICFKDSANNWDNNNGLNWSWGIHGGKQHFH